MQYPSFATKRPHDCRGDVWYRLEISLYLCRPLLANIQHQPMNHDVFIITFLHKNKQITVQHAHIPYRV